MPNFYTRYIFLHSYRFVLSAAHCTSWRGVRPKIIRLGEQNLKHRNSQVEDFGIALSIRHPKYRAASKYNDIALFQLDRNVRISDFIKPACLWQKFDVSYKSGIATGWGLTRDRGRQSDELLKVQLNFISNERCNGFYQRFQALKDGIIDTQICAGDDIEERDTCNGDSGKKSDSNYQVFSNQPQNIYISNEFIEILEMCITGGPVQVATANSACSYHLIGITSFGMGCGNGYGVYTRISEYLDWIESIAWKDSD